MLLNLQKRGKHYQWVKLTNIIISNKCVNSYQKLDKI